MKSSMSPAVVQRRALTDVARPVVSVGHEVDGVGCHGYVGNASDEARRILVKCPEDNVVHATYITETKGQVIVQLSVYTLTR